MTATKMTQNEVLKHAKFKALVQRFIKLLGGNVTLIAGFVDYDVEYGSDPSSHYHKVKLYDALKDIANPDDDGIDWLDTITDFEGLARQYVEAHDYDGGGCFGMWTEKAHNENMAEKRRQELERVAKAFAARTKKKIGTFEFIRAVEKAITRVRDDQQHFNSGEARMERYADYAFSGCRDNFFTDNDFENGRYESRIDDLEGIFDWLRDECPLLMAKYEEKKLAGEWKDDDAE